MVTCSWRCRSSNIKCTSKNPHGLSGTRIMQNLQKSPGFLEQDGWKLGMSTRTIALTNKLQAAYMVTFKRPYYIIHAQDMIIITCQDRARMDLGGKASWAGIQPRECCPRCGGELLVACDIRGCQNGPALIEVFTRINVELTTFRKPCQACYK